jgi:prophage antirepressor-like protein
MENKKFFLDIFNQLLKVNENNILIIFDKDNNIWFCFKDVLKSLGYSDIKHTYNSNIISEFNKSKFENLQVVWLTTPPANFQKKTLFINESGLYEVLNRSKKDIAKIFMNKYFQEIMPEIRRNGQYILNKNDKNKLDELNNKLDNYKTEMTYYNNKYKFIPSNNGYLYINQNNSIKDGDEVKCFKIGYATDMKERLSGYKVGNFSSIAKAMRTAHIMINK